MLPTSPVFFALPDEIVRVMFPKGASKEYWPLMPVRTLPWGMPYSSCMVTLIPATGFPSSVVSVPFTYAPS